MRRTHAHRRPHDEANDFLDLVIPAPCMIQGDTLNFFTPVNLGERIESLYGRKGRVAGFHTAKDGYQAIKLIRVLWDDAKDHVYYIYRVDDGNNQEGR